MIMVFLRILKLKLIRLNNKNACGSWLFHEGRINSMYKRQHNKAFKPENRKSAPHLHSLRSLQMCRPLTLSA